MLGAQAWLTHRFVGRSRLSGPLWCPPLTLSDLAAEACCSTTQTLSIAMLAACQSLSWGSDLWVLHGHGALIGPRWGLEGGVRYSLDPPLREPDIKRTDLAQPPGGLRDGRFQVETAHLPLQNVIFALFRGPGWLREQSTSESSVLLMVGRNCTLTFSSHQWHSHTSTNRTVKTQSQIRCAALCRASAEA